MKQGAEVQARSNRGWNPLMVDVAGGHTEITRLFLDEGAKWDVKSKAGWTALKVAFKLGEKSSFTANGSRGKEIIGLVFF
jgi:ankyrin repeat protein